MAILSKAGITTGNTILPAHVTQIIDSLTSSGSYVLSVSGAFGVNTDNPNAPLNVVGETHFGYPGLSSNSGILFWPDTAFNAAYYIKNNNNFTVGVGGNPYTGTDVFAINAVGNVLVNNNLGVGTTTPLTKLVVSNNGAQGIEMDYSVGLDANYIQSYDRVANKNVDLAYYMAVGVTGSHRFYTNGAERMRIDKDGYVGINTNTPISPLNVNGNTIITGSTTLFNNGGTLDLRGINHSYIQWYPDNSTRRAYFGFASSGSTNIILENENASGNIVLVTNNRFVGINKYTPTSPLDVNGNATVTGSITATSDITSAGTISSPTMTTTNFSSTNLIVGSSTELSGSTTLFNDGATLNLRGVNSSIIQWYPDSNIRRSYFGFSPTSPTNIILENEISNGNIALITNNGRIGVNKYTPNTTLDVGGNALITGSLTTTGNVVVTGSLTLNSLITASGDIMTSTNIRTRGGVIDLGNSGGNRTAFINSDSDKLEISRTTNHPMWFSTNGTEKMRITGGGNVGIGTIAPPHKLTVVETTATDTSLFSNTNASFTNACIVPATTRISGTNCFFIYGTANSINTFQVYNNGNVGNTNSSYGGLSDIKLKENIVNTTPKLEKLKQVRIVNYNFKEDLGYESFKQIGVIAQELEQVFPGLIEETPDRDTKGKLLNTTTKSVKYSVFVPILIKAIQEQQAQIEELKLQVATLISGSL